MKAPAGPDQPLGAVALDAGRCGFLVWAPAAERVEVVLADGRVVGMEATARGYHQVVVADVGPRTRYRYRLHRPGREPVDRPDPASRWQPDGVHGWSAVDVAPSGGADDGWRNPPLSEHVIYELHVGTFTPAGTFGAVTERLDDLRDVGVTAIELMPVWQFPGGRNWGYDGVLPYAVQDTYGGPEGLRRLVDAAHRAGIAVFLDVVYNHFGPEGNHLPDFGPYLTSRYDTPWGRAVNVDGPMSDEVRRYVVENAVRWVRDFHLDGLRLDAVHAIVDLSAVHVLEELAAAVHDEAARLGRRVQVIAESDLSDPRLVRDPRLGGYGLDGQWLDDVHHALHVALTGERDGYYVDYDGLSDLGRSLVDRYAYAGRYSTFRRRTVGRPAPDVAHHRFVVCAQNHDQVGNRMVGERLSTLVSFDRLKVAAALVLLSPFTPMLFMGEEYGETSPFLYFVSHGDPELVEAVRAGRRAEFAAFAWRGEAPDPQAETTFARCRLDWSSRHHGDHAVLLALHRELIRVRRRLPAVASPAGDVAVVVSDPVTVAWHRTVGHEQILVAGTVGDTEARVALPHPLGWEPVLDTAARRWNGPWDPTGPDPDTAELSLAPNSVVLLRRDAPQRDGRGA